MENFSVGKLMSGLEFYDIFFGYKMIWLYGFIEKIFFFVVFIGNMDFMMWVERMIGLNGVFV